MKTSNGKQLAKKMLIAMICGLACGFGCIMLREHLVSSGQTDLWTKINNLFFQDITQPTATKAVGIFYNLLIHYSLLLYLWYLYLLH